MRDFIRVVDCRIARNKDEKEFEPKDCDRLVMFGASLFPADWNALPFS